MAIFDIFSKRQERFRGEVTDAYIYDAMPTSLRQQVVYILSDFLQDMDSKSRRRYDSHRIRSYQTYSRITDILRREYGVPWLAIKIDVFTTDNKECDLNEFLIREQNVEKILDAIEISFQICRGTYRGVYDRKRFGEAESDLNTRFSENGIGYALCDGRIMRVDSGYAHAKIVKPALQVLSGRRYAGAQAEFLKAHQHFRKREGKDSLSECHKAFESVMKVICEKRGWPVREHATAKDLVDACFTNGLLPEYWMSQFKALRSLLDSGVTVGRNRLAGHGQGATPKEVPVYVAAYVLHMTAAAIVFLAEADEAS